MENRLDRMTVLIGVGDYNSDRKALYPSGRTSGSQGSSLKIRLYVGISILPNFLDSVICDPVQDFGLNF